MNKFMQSSHGVSVRVLSAQHDRHEFNPFNRWEEKLLDLVSHPSKRSAEWTLSEDITAVKEQVRRTVSNIQIKYPFSSDVLELDILLYQVTSLDDPTLEIRGDLRGNRQYPAILVGIETFNARRLEAVLTHELLHVLYSPPAETAAHDALDLYLLRLAIEEGVAEAFVRENMSPADVKSGASDLAVPEDLVQLHDFRHERHDDPKKLNDPKDAALKSFLEMHKHYAAGYHIVTSLIDGKVFDLTTLIDMDPVEVWKAYLP